MGFISHCFDWHSGRNSRSLVSILSCCEGWVFFPLKGCQDTLTLTTGFLKIRCVWNLFPQYTPPRHFLRASVMNRYNSPLWTEVPVNPSFSYKNCPQGGNSVQSTFSAWDKLKKSEVAQSCPSLWDPMDCSLPGFSVHGILQARILERVAISFSRGPSWPRDRTQVSRIVSRRLTLWATRLSWAFPHGSAGEESACNAGDLDSIPGLGRSLRKGKGYPLQYSGLENSID